MKGENTMKKGLKLVLLLGVLLGGFVNIAAAQQIRVQGKYTVNRWLNGLELGMTGDSLQFTDEKDGTGTYELRAFISNGMDSTGTPNIDGQWFMIGHWNSMPCDSLAESIDGYIITWGGLDSIPFIATRNCYRQDILLLKHVILIKDMFPNTY